MARSQLLKNYLPDGEVNLITKEAGKNTSDRNDKKEKKKNILQSLYNKNNMSKNLTTKNLNNNKTTPPSIPQKGKQAQSLQQKINRNQRWRT